MTPPPPEHRLPAVEDDDIADHERTTERVQRAQWLRAAILGANDLLISTASLMLGMDSIRGDRRSMVLSGSLELWLVPAAWRWGSLFPLPHKGV